MELELAPYDGLGHRDTGTPPGTQGTPKMKAATGYSFVKLQPKPNSRVFQRDHPIWDATPAYHHVE